MENFCTRKTNTVGWIKAKILGKNRTVRPFLCTENFFYLNFQTENVIINRVVPCRAFYHDLKIMLLHKSSNPSATDANDALIQFFVQHD